MSRKCKFASEARSRGRLKLLCRFVTASCTNRLPWTTGSTAALFCASITRSNALGPVGTGGPARIPERLRVDPVFLVQHAEEPVRLIHRLGGAQKQAAFGLQGEMKRIQHALLRIRVQIDQQVATGDQVHPRERRVLDQVVGGKQYHFAQLAAHAVAIVVLDKKPPEAFLARPPQSSRGNGRYGPRESLRRRGRTRRPATTVGRQASAACSIISMAIEYASSPVAQAGTQMRNESVVRPSP